MTKYAEMKDFLDAALPGKKVVYGYPRTAKPAKSGTSQSDVYITYMYVQKDVAPAVGQRIMSTKEYYTITVQANYAKTCSDWLNVLLRATEGTNVQFFSSSVRKDPNIESSCIGSITLSLYKGDSDII